MSRSAREYHHGDLARVLEQAAVRLLEEKPAAMIGLREVARAAGVSHNAPYHHFSDRRGLLKVLAERSMADLLAAVRSAIAGQDSPAEVLLRGGQAYISFGAEHPHAFEVIYDPTVCIPGSPTEAMAPLISELETLLETASVRAGLPPATGANGLWGLMHGLATLTAAGHQSPEQATAAYAELLPRILLARSS